MKQERGMKVENRIQEIIEKLTLEEKASLCSGADCWYTKALPEKGIPAIRMCDGPSGLRFQSGEDDHMGVHASTQMVSYPTGCAMASSFDRELMERVGQAIGEESRSVGVSLVLGPASNIKRNPLCGRNFEYLSEDPYLTGEMSAAEIRGIQSQNVGACMKHYACNNQETWRMKVDAHVDERTLREIYLAGFETAVKQEQPCALMASYNRVNGEHVTENHHLLTEILREEWGFDGFIVSDWGASNNRMAGVAAGMDLEMPGCNGITDEQLVRAVREGTLKEEVLDKAAGRIIGKVLQYESEPTGEDFAREEHHELAVRAAAESAVLLKNEGRLLPLQEGKKIVYIGRFAEMPRFQGGGSACVNPFKLTNALAGSEGISGVSYVPGFTEEEDRVNETWQAEALKAAAEADTAVIFAGLPEVFESESYDRPDMKLPSCQNQLIDAVCEIQKNVAVVLCSGSAVEMPWADRVSSILQMHTGGQGTGEAAVRLLYGRNNPCGRLAETYPLRLQDVPSYLNFPGDGKTVKYQEGIFVGYRYYDAKDMEVLFPFGHGLSYTEFSYDNLCVNKDIFKEDDILEVSVDITNTGDRFGKEVVQLYVSDITHQQSEKWEVDRGSNVFVQENDGYVSRPRRELKGFVKTGLEPGETKTVNFQLDRRSFAWYNVEKKDWDLSPGNYQIQVGASSRDIRKAIDICLRKDEKKVPACVSMDTLMSEISPYPELWQMTLDYLSGACPKLDEIIHGTDSTASYLKEELKELPLYAVRGLYAVRQEAMDGVIEVLNEEIGRMHKE